jgi:hypothetical protein
MEKLSAEILLLIIETSESVPELLTYRNISRSFRILVDDKCKRLAFRLGRQHIHAFDDALLAVRLKRIPWESCCHYDLQRGDYSFFPSRDFLQAVMEGREVPPGCPTVPPATWYGEMVAVMDLYLLTLAWMSTSLLTNGVNDSVLWPGGVEIPEVDLEGVRPKPLTEAYLRSTFRIFAFTSLYGPRVIAEPVSAVSALALSSTVDTVLSDTQEQHAQLQEKIDRYPLLSTLWDMNQNPRDPALYPIFDGFFGWLYAQSEPRNHVTLYLPESYYDADNPENKPLTLTEDERQQLALVQLLKLYDIMHNRKFGVEPNLEYHVASSHNPMYTHLDHAVTVYRPRLQQLSAWSEPQSIINEWADSENASLVLQRVAASDDNIYPDMCVFSTVMEAQLKHRFGLRHQTPRLDLTGIDYGVLDPSSELEDWDDWT